MLRSAIKMALGLNIDAAPLIGLLLTGSLWLAWSGDGWPGDKAMAAALWAVALAAILADLIGGVARIRKEKTQPIRPSTRQRLMFWLPVAALLVTAATLFAAGHGILAVVAQMHLFGRLSGALMMATQTPTRFGDQARVVEDFPLRRAQMNRLEIGSTAYAGVLVAGLLWMLAGNSPGWLQDMTITAWWLSLLAVAGAVAFGFHHNVEIPLPTELRDRLFANAAGTAGAEDGILTPWLTRRVGVVFCLLACIALAAAGQIALTCIMVLSMMILRAEAVQKKMLEAEGGSTRIDPVSRFLHGLLVNAISLIVSPARYVNTLLGTGPARDTAVLREAFGRPGGFIYFLYEQPQHRDVFLEDGGLLEPFARHVVERKWDGEMVMAPADTEPDSRLVAAEREMLARYKVNPADTRKNFVLVVPPRGYARRYRFLDASEARIGVGSVDILGIQYRFMGDATKAFGRPAD